MTDTSSSPDSVFVAVHEGTVHVLKSVASFPQNGSGSDEDAAASEHLTGLLDGRQLAPVKPEQFNPMHKILV